MEKNQNNKTQPFLIRNMREAALSCMKEGWRHNDYNIYAIFVKGDAVRIIMNDGRSGNVQWDKAPPIKINHLST